MKYSFIDWDKRDYLRETKGKIKISSTPKDGDNIIINMIDGTHNFITLNLERKEAKSISIAIESALNDINLDVDLDK